MFEEILAPADARRATLVVTQLMQSGLSFALTGGVAMAARLRARAGAPLCRELSDLDVVVASAVELIETRPELIVAERYGPRTEPCARCRVHGAFRPVDPERVVAVLGYS
jgi:hypothetical protein